MNDYLETRELYHHGIKGQRWGIRRFQNEDGTLTKAGIKKYGTLSEKATRMMGNYAEKALEYNEYKEQYDASDRYAKENLSSTQYARYVTSGARVAQNSMLKRLENVKNKDYSKLEKYLSSAMKKYDASVVISKEDGRTYIVPKPPVLGEPQHKSERMGTEWQYDERSGRLKKSQAGNI